MNNDQLLDFYSFSQSINSHLSLANTTIFETPYSLFLRSTFDKNNMSVPGGFPGMSGAAGAGDPNDPNAKMVSSAHEQREQGKSFDGDLY